MFKKPLFVLIAFQLLIIVGMIGLALYPLIEGTDAEFEIIARDPRDVFRGSYVQLNYRFSVIDLDSVKNDLTPGKTYNHGRTLYLQLELEGKYYIPAGLFQKPPQSGLFMKVMPAYPFGFVLGGSQSRKGRMYLKAGIESFFTDPDEAKEIERLIQRRTITDTRATLSVTVAISSSGQARIRRVNFPQ